MKHIALIGLTASLVACQPAFINGVPNEASPYFTVPVDSKVILRKSVTVPAGEETAFFQRGQAMPWNKVNQYGTYCSLKLAVRRDAPQTINPDELVVRKVTQENRFRVAYAPGTKLATLDTDSSFTYEVLSTVMQVQSARQPDIKEMACADWSTPQGITPISVRKMRQALGDWADLQIAKP